MTQEASIPEPFATGVAIAKQIEKSEGLDLESDEPLTPVCDLSGDGTCEACQ